MSTITSSSSVVPKVLPTGGWAAATRSAGLSDSPTPFDDALASEPPAHYGPQDLLACACAGGDGQTIFVYDMNSVQLVQTLYGHTAAVTSVRWKAPRLSYQQHGLFLLSGDLSGTLLLWDVTEGVTIGRLRVPCQQPIQILSLLTDQHLLVVTSMANSYVFNAHLIDATVLPPAPLPLRCKEGPRPSVRLCASKLSAGHASVVLMADRARIISHLDPARASRPTARDLIYDSEHGEVTVVDAFFSESEEEVLYFATPTFVGSYDWKAAIVLSEQMLWTRDGVEFTRIFPSAPTCFEDRTGAGLPLMYSFTTDQRLTAWFPQRAGKFTSVSTDVRGARITSKAVAAVVPSDLDTNLFAVLFEDGSVCRWQFRTRSRRWCLTHYSASPLQRPTCLCRAAASYGICCALESGHVALYDARHSVALKRMNLVYSGGTRIILMCPHRHDDAVWLVSCRAVDGRHHHQISLLDTRSGEVVRVLRKPTAGAEVSRAKALTMDTTGAFLLFAFWNGTFEVWSAEDGRLLHMHAGLGVASVSWAPSSLRRCLTGVQGSPQLLSVVFSEGTLSLWSVYRDRCVASRDAVPFLNAASVTGGTVQAATVGPHLVMFDSAGVGIVVGARAARLASQRLKNLPGEGMGPVRCLAGRPLAAAAALSSSFASFDVFGGDTTTAPGVDGTGGLSHTTTLDTAPLVAAVFDDGSFGVWDVSSGERLGYSAASPVLRGVAAAEVLWLDEVLAVLCRETGVLLLVDPYLSTVNSPVSARALRRPLQNPSFLSPAQRTHLQTSMVLLLEPPADAADWEPPALTETQANDPDKDGGQGGAAAEGGAPSSAAASTVAHRSPPGRGPLGQLMDDRPRTVQGEIALYARTMLPRPVAAEMALARAQRSTTRAALCMARWFGQRERQRLWAVLDLLLHPHPRNRSGEAVRGTPPPPMAAAPAEVCEPCAPTELRGEAGVPYLFADPFAVSSAASDVVRWNCLALAEARARAVQHSRDEAVDDSHTRVRVARDFLALGEAVKAVDVLLDCSFERPRFNELSTLALAIAAGAAAAAVGAPAGGGGGGGAGAGTPNGSHPVNGGGSSPSTSSAALYALATKRAAAMLLAAGEVDAAVEKFMLAGEYAEACRALESHGRWHELVMLAKVSPLAPPARCALLQRWALHCARSELGTAGLPASRILLSQGLAREALEVLATSAHLTDVAGTLAVALARHYAELPVGSTASTSAAEGHHNGVSVDPSPRKLFSLLLSVLGDYSSVLQSVGSVVGEQCVLNEVTTLKKLLRGQQTAEAGDGVV